MTTTDSSSGYPPPFPGGHPAPGTAPVTDRVLRRSRQGRVGAGVAAGLGRYFNVDPVLFRVLFATSAFFGGAGIIAYVLLWVAIPEEGTERAAIDGWIASLRRHRVPVWVVAVAALVVLWAVAFSWWVPGRFIPVLIAVLILVVAFGRRGGTALPAPEQPPAAAAPGGPEAGAPVDLGKPDSLPPSETRPSWTRDARAWVDESRAARARRRRRALPVRLATVIVLVVTLAVLGTADAVGGIVLPVYFWVTLGIVGTGLLVGMALRRTPWSLALLLVPTIGGLIAFGGTRASLHDGIGDRYWQPTVAPSSSYRLAFGQGVLDLRHLQPQSAARTIDITMAAGQVRVLADRTQNVTVDANIHIGALTVDGMTDNSFGSRGGYNYSREILPPKHATGAPITVIVHLADGHLAIGRS